MNSCNLVHSFQRTRQSRGRDGAKTKETEQAEPEQLNVDQKQSIVEDLGKNNEGQVKASVDDEAAQGDRPKGDKSTVGDQAVVDCGYVESPQKLQEKRLSEAKVGEKSFPKQDKTSDNGSEASGTTALAETQQVQPRAFK